ncbi:hypothetical protein HDU92_008588 [Lobulomyces angularis]|nr:hypothetical protein HDU92_008588 [Lobulomyces angularis]
MQISEKVVHFDHAGSTTINQKMISDWTSDIILNEYSNPHSNSKTTNKINEIRKKILSYLNTSESEFTVIFTHNATGALKLTGESVDWKTFSFSYLNTSHTSVVGIRNLVELAGSQWQCLHEKDIEKILKNNIFTEEKKVFAFPAQCNFSGKRYNLSWIKLVENITGFQELNLTNSVGALIVKNEMLPNLSKKVYFGGGTVEGYNEKDWVRLKPINSWDRFEDGTLPFLEIISIEHGFKFIEREFGDWETLKQKVINLNNLVRESMRLIKHENGSNVVKFYPDVTLVENVKTEFGPIINFNILRADGSYLGYFEVFELANLHKFNIRVGCFCNLGACQEYLGISSEEFRENTEVHGHVCGDSKDLINGKPTGSIRISFGYSNSMEECEQWLIFMETFFAEKRKIRDYKHPIDDSNVESNKNFNIKPNLPTLASIELFPIKSCGSLKVTKWTVNDSGLQFDRHWMLVNENGQALTQKLYPKMCLIRPISITVDQNIVVLTVKLNNKLLVIQDSTENKVENEVLDDINVRYCGKRTTAKAYSDGDLAKEFSEFLGIRCFLVKNSSDDLPHRSTGISETEFQHLSLKEKSSFSNESQFLFINLSSVLKINEMCESESISYTRFRGNLLIDGRDNLLPPFDEDNWKIGTKIQIGSQIFFCKGSCDRCQMVCVDQSTGLKSKEPFSTLAKYRRVDGKIKFGHHLQHSMNLSAKPYIVNAGDKFQIIK